MNGAIERKGVYKSNKPIGIFLLKSCHITGLIISSYMVTILLSIGFSAQTASIIVAILGIMYPLTSLIAGITSDFYGRSRIFQFSKLISIIGMIFAIVFHTSKILTIFLVLSVCIENGIESLISAVATDISDSRTRKSIFGIIQLGSSIGMAFISIVSSVVFNLNLVAFLAILIVFDAVSIIVMQLIFSDSAANPKKQETKSEVHEYSIRSIVFSNRTLLLFSAIQIFFSILLSQLNFGLTLKIKSIFPEKSSSFLGISLFIYYFVMILFNFLVNKLTKKNTYIANLVIAGFIYTAAMLFMTYAGNIGIIGWSMALWAIAQLLLNINYGAFVAENCNKNNIGAVTAFFSIISGSGVVIGPLLSGWIYQVYGILRLWQIMVIISLIGTLLMLFLYILKKNKKGNTAHA